MTKEKEGGKEGGRRERERKRKLRIQRTPSGSTKTPNKKVGPVPSRHHWKGFFEKIGM